MKSIGNADLTAFRVQNQMLVHQAPTLQVNNVQALGGLQSRPRIEPAQDALSLTLTLSPVPKLSTASQLAEQVNASCASCKHHLQTAACSSSSTAFLTPGLYFSSRQSTASCQKFQTLSWIREHPSSPCFSVHSLTFPFIDARYLAYQSFKSQKARLAAKKSLLST